MKTSLKVLAVLCLVAVIGFFGFRHLREFQFRNDYNDAVATLDSNEYRAAVDRFEALLTTDRSGAYRDEIVRHLLIGYRALADEPGASLEQRAGFLRRIQELDPDSLTGPERKLIEWDDKRADSPAPD